MTGTLTHAFEHTEPDSSSPFVAASRKSRTARSAVARWARWLGAEPLYQRPLPTDRPGLVITTSGLSLHTVGTQKGALWHPGMVNNRLSHAADDALCRALDLRTGETVFDGTLGMGHDAVILARQGARVLGHEASALVAAYTLDGLPRFYPHAAKRISVRRTDHVTALMALPADCVDHVYLDPMFQDAFSRSHTLGPLRQLLGTAPQLADSVIKHALRVARRRLVVKLGPQDRPSAGARVVGSRRVRFAVWS